MPNRLYCTVQDVADDMRLKNLSEERVPALDFIRAASDWIDRHLGKFIPETRTYWFDGTGTVNLWIPRDKLVLSITTITNDGDTLASTDYILYGDGPRKPLWENGPYNRLTVDPDASNLSHWTCEEDIISIAGSFGLYSEAVDTGFTVGSNQSDSATTLVGSSSSIPVGSVLLIGSEQELVTANHATSYTVVRGINGTTAAAHLSAATISRYIPPWDVRYLCQQIAVLMKKKADSGYAGKVGSAELGEVFYHKEFPKEVYQEIRRNYTGRLVSV